VYTSIHTYIHPFIHTYIHTYIHTCIHIIIYTYTGEDPNNRNTWDGGRIFGCLCDTGFHGYDCSLSSCPRGDDPGTYNDNNEVQLLTCRATDGYFTLTFRQETTGPIYFNATASFVAKQLSALSTTGPTSVFFIRNGALQNSTLSATQKPPLPGFQGEPLNGFFNVNNSFRFNYNITTKVQLDTPVCKTDGTQTVIIQFDTTHGPLPPITGDNSQLFDTSFGLSGGGSGRINVFSGGASINGLRSLTGIYIYIYIYMNIHICLYVYINVNIYIYFKCVYEWIYIYVFICMYVYKYICIYKYLPLRSKYKWHWQDSICIWKGFYMYVCVYVHMYMYRNFIWIPSFLRYHWEWYIYIHIYIYMYIIYLQKERKGIFLMLPTAILYVNFHNYYHHHRPLGTTENAVCSNRGLCDEKTGQCACFPSKFNIHMYIYIYIYIYVYIYTYVYAYA
jgi:hypothetical protein